MTCSGVCGAWAKLGLEIENLAADHVADARRACERQNQRSADRGVGSCRGIRCHVESVGEQRRRQREWRSPRHRLCVSSAGRGADRRCRAPADRHAPANSNGSFPLPPGAQNAFAFDAEKPRGFDEQKRTQPFAAAEARIAHGLKKPRRTIAFRRAAASGDKRRSSMCSVASATELSRA